MQHLGEKIGLLVRAKGWQMKDFAARIGYTAEHFSRLLNSETLPPKALGRIAKGLDLLPEDLLRMELLAGQPAAAIVSEPDAPYSATRATGQAGLASLQQEIARLQSEVDRLLDMLQREQAISADLAEALKRISGGKK